MVVGLAVMLSACGFQLRGTGVNDFALSELDVKARNAFGETLNDVRDNLANHGVRLTSQAPYTLVLVREEESTRAASYSNLGRGSEQQLNLALHYQILDQKEHVLVSDKVQSQRFYLQDYNNVIGSSEEARQIKNEMRQELIQQLLQQLHLLTPERLSELTQLAEQKAQHEASHAH